MNLNLNSPLQTRLAFGNAPNGAPLVSVLAKATFMLGQGYLRVPNSEDEVVPFWEHVQLEQGVNPLASAVRHESDLVAFEPYCQVVLHGEACAPAGKRAKFFDMGISVGTFIRKIRILGKRFVDASKGNVQFSEPESFERMPLKLALAYGGQDSVTFSGQTIVNPYNPFGKGFWVNPEPTAIHGSELPCLENPGQLLDPSSLFIKRPDNIEQAPRPAHLGALPRVRTELPGFLIPYIRGNETITLAFMDSEHPQYSFALPNVIPILRLDFGEGPTTLDVQVQKIEIDKMNGTLTLLWRGSSYCAEPEALVENLKMEVIAEMREVNNV